MRAIMMMTCWFLVAQAAVAQDLKSRMDKILRAHSIPAAHVGLAVYDVSKTPHEMIYGHNHENDMIPASVTKIATAAAVLRRLGASFKFQTTLWTAGAVKDGVLTGDLVLKGGGDAGFVSESMWFLVNELVRTGMKQVDGSIVVDDTDFDSVRADTSRDPERVDRAYDAPVGAMSFNWNSMNIFVRPTQTGQPPQVYLDPIDNGFTVDNNAKTVNNAGTAIEVVRNGSKVTVRGSIGLSAPEFVAYKNIDDPVEWSGRNLLFFMEQRGIKVSGKVKSGKKPQGARLLAKAESKPVSLHVTDMMKFSNNYVAEMLTKNLAAQDGQVPASLDHGMRLIRQTVEEMGIDGKRFTLINPSGLSRRNRLKPVDLAKILVKSQEHFPSFAEMLSSFPLSGMDGTLKNRMKDTEFRGWVRAKTGLLTGVVALAGYAGRKDGGVRAFAFVFNGKGEQGEAARRLFDALATELVQ